MIKWHESFKESLHLVKGVEVFFIWPQEWPENNNAIITYAGVGDSPDMADDKEYATDVRVKVDIYHQFPLIVRDTACSVDDVLSEAGYVRDGATPESYDVNSGRYHKIIYYKKLLGG